MLSVTKTIRPARQLRSHGPTGKEREKCDEARKETGMATT